MYVGDTYYGSQGKKKPHVSDEGFHIFEDLRIRNQLGLCLLRRAYRWEFLFAWHIAVLIERGEGFVFVFLLCGGPPGDIALTGSSCKQK